MALSMDVDTGDPDTNLANAIIYQAALDYRSARRFLRKNPRTEALEAAAERNEKNRRLEGKAILTPEEKLLAKIKRVEREAMSCERFFKSRLFETLSNLDGQELFNKLRREEDDADGACEDMASAPEAAFDGIISDGDVLSWL